MKDFPLILPSSFTIRATYLSCTHLRFNLYIKRT
ncbi:unnamed protein product [Tenebrio molitor]|nr:unnamed protein product [Tenebrio molitor]